MAISSGGSTPSVFADLLYAQFGLDVYLDHYKKCLDMVRFEDMPSNSDAETVYDARNGIDRETAFAVRIHC